MYMKTLRPIYIKTGNTTNLNNSFSIENEKRAAQVGLEPTTCRGTNITDLDKMNFEKSINIIIFITEHYQLVTLSTIALFLCSYIVIYYSEPLNADTFGTKQNCPDYRGVHISGFFIYRKCIFQTNIALRMITMSIMSAFH